MDTTLTDPTQSQRWGFWATLGLSAIIVGVYFVVQVGLIFVLYAIAMQSDPGLDFGEYFKTSINGGIYISLATLLSAWLCMVLIVIFSSLRRELTAGEYLGLKDLPVQPLGIWLAVTLVFVYSWQWLYALLKLSPPTFMVDIYQSTDNLYLLWAAIVLAAPLLEEFFFRGFLFEGIRDSRLGPIGAVAITSVIWGLIHLQYGTFEISMIILLGVVFGWAKIQSRSLWVPIVCHVVVNFLAMMETAFSFGPA